MSNIIDIHSISDIFRRHSNNLRAANKDYKINVIAVNDQVLRVLQSQLPKPQVPPLHWDQAIHDYKDAQLACRDWTLKVMSQLLTTPFSIVNSDQDVRKSLDAAIKIAEYMVHNPHDTSVRAVLIDQLDSLNGKFSWIASLARNARLDIENFGDNLPRIAGDLERTARTALDGSRADASQIANYQKKVNDLNIKLTAAYVLLAAEIAAAIIFVVLATTTVFPANLIFALVAALDEAAIIITKQGIADLKAAIEYDYKQMDKLTQDMALLNACSTAFSALAQDTKALQDKVTAIWLEWAKLGDETASALASIRA